MTTENTNGPHPEDMPDIQESEAQGRMVSGINDALGLENGSGFGARFDLLVELSKASVKAEEWMARAWYNDDREVAIDGLDERRQNRARFGWSNPGLVEWHTSLRRGNIQGRLLARLERMYISEKNRRTEEQQSPYEHANNGFNQSASPDRLR